jgi:LPS-assembly protein
MKNNFINLLILIFCILITVKNVNANEPFVFDVTEIEILKEGNQINGYKGGTATSEDGSTIAAENFFYNKLTNILETNGNVKYFDKTKNIIITSDKAIYFKNTEKIYTIGNSKVVSQKNTITASKLEYDKINNFFLAKGDAIVTDLEKNTKIYSDEITYLKNKEKFFTSGETKALIDNKYKFDSKNVTYLRIEEKLFSNNKSSIDDDNGNTYKLENFFYDIKSEILKGKNVNVLAKVEEDKFDKYFFSEGFFDFKNKSHSAKETKVITHKDAFDNEEQDPRIYGASSYSNQNKTIINNAIFTSCKINDSCPPWSIKAEKITHDKIKKDMIYKNAILKIYDVPVLYFPKFFHPDPSVDRRSGFLRPQFNDSETLGSSLYIPYFKTLGHDKDLTFKPTFFEKLKKFKKEKYILQTEFRKKNKSSSLIADVAFLRDYKSLNDYKYRNSNHFFLNFIGDLNLSNFTNSSFSGKVERVNNATYLKVFQNIFSESPVFPTNQTTMNSNFELYLDKEDQNLKTGIQIYENLDKDKNDRYQYSFPYYDLSKDITSLIENINIPGALNFSSSGDNTLKNTNNLKTSIQNNLTYNSPDFISNLGFKNNFNLYFKNSNVVAKNDSTYTSSTQIDGMSILKIDSSLPLIKNSDTHYETLTPKISFMFNPGNNMNNHSGSSAKVNVGNVFGLNRLNISDFEAGRSFTLGLDYKFDPIEINQDDNEDIKDKYLEFKLATVFRDEIETDIPVSSTLNRTNSNIFGSIDSKLLNNFDFNYSFSLDNDMKTINSHGIGSEISINNFVTTFNFIEERNEIGTTHLLSNTTEYKINDNSSLKFSTRRNKEINLTEYYNLSYEYENDCLTAALRFNKNFYKDRDLIPTENLFFTITLIPLTTYEREIYKKIPGTSGLEGWFR